MNTKQILVQNIREWVKLDNEIRALKKEEKARQTEKKQLNENLIEIMKSNEIDCVDIKVGLFDGWHMPIRKPHLLNLGI